MFVNQSISYIYDTVETVFFINIKFVEFQIYYRKKYIYVPSVSESRFNILSFKNIYFNKYLRNIFQTTINIL